MERRIVEAVHANCQKDLVRLHEALGWTESSHASSGFAAAPLVFAAIQLVKKHWEIIPRDLQERLRDRAEASKQLALYLEKQSDNVRAFSVLERESLKAQSLSLRDGSVQIGEYLGQFRKNRDQGITLLLGALLTYKEDFSAWKALSSVLYWAFDAAGIDAKQIKAINEDSLRKSAAAIQRRGKNPSHLSPPLTHSIN
jgi:hypothetical protein